MRHPISSGDSCVGLRFSTETGSDEFYATITSPAGSDFEKALEHVHRSYEEFMAAQGLSKRTQVFCRIYVSDIENQKKHVRASRLHDFVSTSPFSMIQEIPLCGGPVAMTAYHIRNEKKALAKKRVTGESDVCPSMLLSGVNYRTLWHYNCLTPELPDSYAQTREIFEKIESVVRNNNMTLLDNTIRTWVYVRDVDNNYKGMVRARREFFAHHDLTQKTRYLASTGIEGKSAEVSGLVHVDGFSVADLEPEQIVRMEALENLSPTIDYGVTFERGLRVRYGDRSHLYISGTASIDKFGKILHYGDVRRQTVRTIENVEALLTPHGGSLEDMAYLLVYVRDPHSLGAVKAIVEEHVSQSVPTLFIEGCVCRPSWLVEMEGVAVIEDTTRFPVFF